MIVAIPGGAGSFSECAALQVAGPGAALRYCHSFADVFFLVARGRVTCGVVPVMNSIVGAIDDNADRLSSDAFRLLTTLDLAIQQCLIGARGTARGAIRRVYSHPVALRQCRRFLRGMASCEAIATTDTATAVRDVIARGLAGDAAIGSRAAATLYGGVVLAEGIEDASDNVTRFVCFERRATRVQPRARAARA